MPDEIDAIVERGEALREAEIARVRLRPGPGALTCEDCDAPIPAARRAAMPSATRCIRCQEEMEKARG